MPLANPYKAVNVTAASELEALACEYMAIGEPLSKAITKADQAGFADAEATYKAFVALGRELKRCAFVPRLTTAFEQRHGHVSAHDRQRAIYAVYEMTLAAADRDRPRFDRAFMEVTADQEAAEQLLGEFRVVGELLKSWVYHPHVRRFHHRAVAFIQNSGATGAFHLAPDGQLWIEDAALRLFRGHLSDEAFASLALWKDWQSSPSDYGEQVNDDGNPFPTPEPPIRPVPERKPPVIPVWDADTNTLTVGESYTKKYARQAKNALKLLNAFHKVRWDKKIANPLSNKVISAALRDINDLLGETSPIRFHVVGDGSQVGWEIAG